MPACELDKEEVESRYEVESYARAARPLSPHMTIYQPQITWYMSASHRVTGGILAAGAIAYAIQGPLGLGLNSDALVAEIATLPTSLKLIGKFSLAFPFVYHSFNGVRHLPFNSSISSDIIPKLVLIKPLCDNLLTIDKLNWINPSLPTCTKSQGETNSKVNKTNVKSDNQTRSTLADIKNTCRWA
ncbi:44581_t:CDS:2 [Gigaspora margarita]|uniref:44581_t:CDS:1 n=1 Tax=Gigaspora margarita TaxID=4874 RepID=A0ABN7W430_GIGMA|nr:44581_t:CDS:2 [Gigaspora margarita]